MAITVRRRWTAMDGRSGIALILWCPACDIVHRVELEGAPSWYWDGNADSPTISPSIRVGGVQWDSESVFHKVKHRVAPGEPIICHSFVKNGQWMYLDDCTHSLAGQTVPVPPLPEFLAESLTQ